MDEDVAGRGVLPDTDILENILSVDEDIAEDDTSPLVTLKEASSSFEKLCNFSLQ